MIKSRRISSGGSSRARRSASAPSSAVITVWPSLRSIPLAAFRRNRSSSTSRMRWLSGLTSFPHDLDNPVRELLQRQVCLDEITDDAERLRIVHLELPGRVRQNQHRDITKARVRLECPEDFDAGHFRHEQIEQDEV